MPDALISRMTSLGPGVGSGNSLSSSFRSPRNTTPFMASSILLPFGRRSGLSRPSSLNDTPTRTPEDRHDRVRNAALYASRRQDGRGRQAVYGARLPGAPERRPGQEADRLF